MTFVLHRQRIYNFIPSSNISVVISFNRIRYSPQYLRTISERCPHCQCSISCDFPSLQKAVNILPNVNLDRVRWEEKNIAQFKLFWGKNGRVETMGAGSIFTLGRRSNHLLDFLQQVTEKIYGIMGDGC